MTCHFCREAIKPRQKVEYHHPVYKSRSGKKVAPTHKRCHRFHHSKQGDFKAWGKKAASKKRWAFYLLNVRNHPAYEEHRWSYLMNYGNAGLSAGLIM